MILEEEKHVKVVINGSVLVLHKDVDLLELVLVEVGDKLLRIVHLLLVLLQADNLKTELAFLFFSVSEPVDLNKDMELCKEVYVGEQSKQVLIISELSFLHDEDLSDKGAFIHCCSDSLRCVVLLLRNLDLYMVFDVKSQLNCWQVFQRLLQLQLDVEPLLEDLTHVELIDL